LAVDNAGLPAPNLVHVDRLVLAVLLADDDQGTLTLDDADVPNHADENPAVLATTLETITNLVGDRNHFWYPCGENFQSVCHCSTFWYRHLQEKKTENPFCYFFAFWHSFCTEAHPHQRGVFSFYHLWGVFPPKIAGWYKNNKHTQDKCTT